MVTEIKDDLRQIGVVTHYELLKHLRSRRLLLFIGLDILMIALITIFIPYLELPDDPANFILLYASMISILITLAVAFYCAPAIASEFEERTALLIFPRPIKKTSFLVGKMVAAYIMLALIILFYYALMAILSFVYKGGVDIGIISSLGFALLFMLGAGGIGFMISAMFKSGTIALIATLIFLWVVFTIIDTMYSTMGGEPFFSLTYAANNITTSILDFMTILGIRIDLDHLASHISALVSMIWFAVTSVVSVFLFRVKEF